MKLLSWNVQWCRGMDGRVDPQRIAAEARRLADPDVFCLQEVARHFPEMAGSAGEDQVAELARAMPGYEAFYVPAIDLPGKGERRQFGNLVLSRLPVGRVLRHLLPWPAAPEAQSMQRAAVEVVVQAPFGWVRVTTTHLEYYSKTHRGAQIDRLLELHAEAATPKKPVTEPGSYESFDRGRSAIVCGDFNLPPGDSHHRQMLDGGFVDAWSALNKGVEQPSFHLYDGEPPIRCDFVFVTPDLVPRLKSVRIDAQTQASDHQPVIVQFG